ncbi:MAG: efflux RND transporter periplasmic adaptor subunit [Anaerolineae bacterium]
MSKARLTYLLVFVVVALGAGLIVTRLGGRSAVRTSPEGVQLARVERGDLVATVFAVGNVIPVREAHLSFPIAGTVRTVDVAIGDHVEAGQVLATLDTLDLQSEVANAELNLAIRQAELERLKAGPSESELAAAQAAVKAAQEALDALKAGPSEMELAAARAAVRAARARYEKLAAGPDPELVRQAELQLEQAKNNLWHVQAQRDIACSLENAKSLCDSFQAEVGSMDVAVRMAQLAVERARTPPDEAEVEDARAQLQLAQERLDRLLQGPTAADLAAAEERLATAQANLERLTAGPSLEEIRIAEARVLQADLALQQAKQALADATLVAPFAGIVSAVNYQVGDVVRPDWVGISLVDLSELQIKVSVAEVDIGRVQIGQQAEIILDALLDRPISGEVVNIAPAARSEQGVVNYPVTVRLTEDVPEVRPGMTGNVRIFTGRREGVVMVPNRAVRRQRGQYYVVVARGDEMIETPVRIGLSSDTMTEILEGVEAGDWVVLNPTAIQSGLSGGVFGSGQ